VLCTRASNLLERPQAARWDFRLPAELAKLDRFDLLIADDFSYVRRDQVEISVLFELIAERYESKSKALAANQPLFGLDHIFAQQRTRRRNQPCLASAVRDN
jgi:DNA replication protein DnaC